MERTAKIIVVISPVIAIVSFLTLANNLVVENATINNVGLLVVLLSLAAFAASLVIAAVKRSSRAAEIRQTVPIAPRRHRYIKPIIGIAIILGLYATFRFYGNYSGQQNQPGVKTATLCNTETHSCSSYKTIGKSGDLRVIAAANGAPVAKLEINVAENPGAAQYYMKLTDKEGIALFNDLPIGSYTIYFNLTTLPKQYENSAGTTVGVEIVDGHITEQKIELK